MSSVKEFEVVDPLSEEIVPVEMYTSYNYLSDRAYEIRAVMSEIRSNAW